MRRISRRGRNGWWPWLTLQASRANPAQVQRSPANTPGGTTAMPTFMPSQVVPHTTHRKANIAWRRMEGETRRRVTTETRRQVAESAVTAPGAVRSDIGARTSAGEAAEPERRRIDHRCVTRDQLSDQPPRTRPDAEAMARETGGQEKARQRLDPVDHRHRIRR